MTRCDEVDSLPFVVSTRGWKTKDGPSTFLGCLSDVLLVLFCLLMGVQIF